METLTCVCFLPYWCRVCAAAGEHGIHGGGLFHVVRAINKPKLVRRATHAYQCRASHGSPGSHLIDAPADDIRCLPSFVSAVRAATSIPRGPV